MSVAAPNDTHAPFAHSHSVSETAYEQAPAEHVPDCAYVCNRLGFLQEGEGGVLQVMLAQGSAMTQAFPLQPFSQMVSVLG